MSDSEEETKTKSKGKRTLKKKASLDESSESEQDFSSDDDYSSDDDVSLNKRKKSAGKKTPAKKASTPKTPKTAPKTKSSTKAKSPATKSKSSTSTKSSTKAKPTSTSTRSKKSDSASSKTQKKYDMPGQKKDTPPELDVLRMFYESAWLENPLNEMATKWVITHGLCPENLARIYVDKGFSGYKAAVAKLPEKPKTVAPAVVSAAVPTVKAEEAPELGQKRARESEASTPAVSGEPIKVEWVKTEDDAAMTAAPKTEPMEPSATKVKLE